MEKQEIIENPYVSYGEFKRTLDTELQKAAQSFVRIGYLLKVAGETDVLKDSGYKTMAEFAEAEYHLDASQTSRFVDIYDQYGDPEHCGALLPKYESYGYAKLSEMLTLPKAVADAIGPEYTRSEIREIKQEIKEEQGITDIEVMLEPKPEGEMNIWQQTLKESFRGMPEEYINLYDRLKVANSQDAEKEAIMDILAPAGITTIMARVEGTGRMMISIRGENQDIGLINIRSEEKESESWENFTADILAVIDTDTSVDAKEKWQQIYGMDFPEIEKEEEEKKSEKKPEHIKVAKKIAPAQPKKEERKKEVIPDPEPKQKEISEEPVRNTVRIIPQEDDEPTNEDDAEEQNPEVGNETNESLNKLYSIYRSILPVLDRLKNESGIDQESLKDLCSKADILKAEAESMMSLQQDDNLPGQMNISDYKE